LKRRSPLLGSWILLISGSFTISLAQQPGPAVGERIPAFQATDQSGQVQTLETVRGPKGALLVFFRSADW
jgi:hypothetical protein